MHRDIKVHVHVHMCTLLFMCVYILVLVYELSVHHMCSIAPWLPLSTHHTHTHTHTTRTYRTHTHTHTPTHTHTHGHYLPFLPYTVHASFFAHSLTSFCTCMAIVWIVKCVHSQIAECFLHHFWRAHYLHMALYGMFQDHCLSM